MYWNWFLKENVIWVEVKFLWICMDICALRKTSLLCLSVLQGKKWWRLFGNLFYRHCIKWTGCVKTKLNSLQICQVKHFPWAEILSRDREVWLLHLILFYSRFQLLSHLGMKNMSRSEWFFFLLSKRKYVLQAFICHPSWMTAMSVNLPAKGPQEVRLSEDLEDQDIKAGEDDFQKELVKKYSSFSDMEDGAGHGRGGGWDSPVLSFRHHSGQVLRSCVVGLVFITVHLQAFEKMPGVSKLACLIQAIATPFLN